ncbi:MAG: hypothetical protein GQ558_10570 [Thermoplasmata archaeon]|nr:hypothetical protein [Thermoplasmata archaeon]
MNIRQLPAVFKEDIEDASLSLLSEVNDRLILIGGWAVRAHLGDSHGRFTLDVDGVSNERDLASIRQRLMALGLKEERTDWGVKFWSKYTPREPVPDEVKSTLKAIELRVEISGPVTKDIDTHHYFEFSLTDFDQKEIAYHRKDAALKVRVPPIETMAAVKLGLPVDFKNNHDVVGLLQVCDIDAVVKVILRTDDWREMVLRRLPKLMGRIQQRGRLENALAIESGIDVSEHVNKLRTIESSLSQ